ncbi:ras-like protein family member 12 [Mya arenaria]|uniref:ras-like protein family member 12 n=1 Tax=Mya arenaria TaxID=6604 RepID=UPI0022E2E1F7|nr:ras-like protein family member 12 [Mya arenaria]XP_052795194.1 ras-like protein family member 12 [Mya arenaria]
MSGRRKQEFNIVLLGAVGVGKSALTVKFITRRFIMEYDPSIEDIYTKQEDVDGQELIVNIMDTFEKDDSNSDRYYSWADAYMIVYGITDRDSFATARDYLVRVTDYLKATGKDCPVALVGNKSDLERYRQITKLEGQALSCDFDGLFFECTAAEEYECVEDTFHGLIYSIQKHRGDKHTVCPPPLFISEERLQSGLKTRPRSPRNGAADKKDEKSPNKKTPTSFKLFNKSFKIFN